MRPGIIAATLLLIAQVFPAQQERSRSGTIEGIVLHALEGTPLARVEVTLTVVPRSTLESNGYSVEGLPNPVLPVFSANDGKFTFQNVEPGSYYLKARRNAFELQNYGQNVSREHGAILTIEAGQTISNLTLRLLPAAVVTGRVRDALGEPVAGAAVSLLRSIPGSDGSRNLEISATAMTDDRGEYRLFWVSSGRYYLSVSPQPNSFETLRPRNLVLRTDYAITYYPGTYDVTRASLVEIKPGSEMHGIDVLVAQAPQYRISGAVTDELTGQSPDSVALSLTHRNLSGPLAVTFPNMHQTKYLSGAFEITNVIPGSYWLRATINTRRDALLEGGLSAPGAAGTLSEVLKALQNRGARVTQIPVDIGGSDVENIALIFGAPSHIPVRILADGQDTSALPNFDRLRVVLRSLEAPNFVGQYNPFDARGMSLIENVSPGEYEVSLTGLGQPDFYVKAVRFGGQDGMQGLRVARPGNEILEIVVSGRGGRVEGVLTNSAQQLVPGVEVVLIPQEPRPKYWRAKAAVTNHDGKFVFRGISPGNYKVFAWESMDPDALANDSFLAQHDQFGTAVVVQETTTSDVTATFIPAQRP